MQENNSTDKLDEVLDRCRQNPDLSVIQELRKITTNPKGLALLGDIESRRADLSRRFADAYVRHGQIRATPETAEAIASYHQDVVTPLLTTLIDELVGIQCELALHKSQLLSN